MLFHGQIYKVDSGLSLDDHIYLTERVYKSVGKHPMYDWACENLSWGYAQNMIAQAHGWKIIWETGELRYFEIRFPNQKEFDDHFNTKLEQGDAFYLHAMKVISRRRLLHGNRPHQ